MDPAISDAIKSTVDASIVRPSNNLTEVIDSRLGSFVQHVSVENGATVKQAVKTIHVKKVESTAT